MKTGQKHVSSLLAVSCPNGGKKAEQISNRISCKICIRSFVEWTRIYKKIKTISCLFTVNPPFL